MVTPLQAKALFFIALLAGQEAARIQQQSRTLIRAQELVTPEQEWQQENHACRWSTWNGGCTGPDGNTTSCKFRFLPLDMLPPFSSQGCRFTDDYMLTHEPHKHFQLQAKLLEAKSQKFMKDCKDAGFWDLKCSRRAKHMYRAMAFMSKAQDSKFMAGLTEEQKAADKALFEKSLENMKSIAGSDAEYVMMLKEKMKARSKATADSVQEIVSLLTKLLQGTEKEREEARTTIKEMGSTPEPMTEEETAKQKEIVENLEGREAELKDLLDNKFKNAADSEEEADDEATPALSEGQKVVAKGLANATHLNGKVGTVLRFDEAKGRYAVDFGGEGAGKLVKADNLEAVQDSSLVQNGAVVRRGDVAVVIKGIAFLIVVMLVVAAVVWAVAEALTILFGFALIILIGCGAYKAGQDGGKIDVEGTMQCIFDVFAWPIVHGAKAIKWVWTEFKPEGLAELEGEIRQKALP